MWFSRRFGSFEVRGGFGGVAKICVTDIEDTCSIGSVVLEMVE